MLLSAVPGGGWASGELHVTVNSLEPPLLPDILKDPIGNKLLQTLWVILCYTYMQHFPRKFFFVTSKVIFIGVCD